MQAAADKIGSVYQKLNASGHFVTKWYDLPHSFNVEMQDDAIKWMER
jgi:hypothetical protein